MANIYVAGPTIRAGTAGLSWVDPVSQEMRSSAEGRAELVFPFAESYLEEAEPRDFHQEIVRRISQSEGVIGVFAPQFISGPLRSLAPVCWGSRNLSSLRILEVCRG